MSAELSEAKRNLVQKIAQDEGFTDFEFDVQSGSMKGDGYLGIINTVNIHEKNRVKKLELIMKSASTVEKLRELTPIRKAYEREIYMYQTVFPELKKFADENNITNRFVEHAKCYGSLLLDKEECIVLENLRATGYQLWDRMKTMDGEHVAAVFRAYGRLHGTSLAFKNLNSEKFGEFAKNMANIFDREEDAENMKKKLGQIFENGFKSVAGNEKATAALTKYSQELGEFFQVTIKEIDKFSTILHGDCWCNNMMFKYEDPKSPSTPTTVRLLDWQLSNVNSPILDLSYFFYACACKEAINDVQKYLKIYHSSLSQTLSEASLNPDSIMTFEELETQWKKYCKYGLFMTMFVMNVVVSSSDEAPDLGALAEAGQDIIESIASTKGAFSEVGLERIRDVILSMVDLGFI